MLLKDSEVERILVINLESISEVLLSLPVTRAIKENYPNAQVTALVTPMTAEITAMNPYIDETLIYDKQGEHQGLLGLVEIVGLLRKANFALAICLNFSLRGAIVAWAAGVNYRIGYDMNFAKIFLTHATVPNRQRVQHQTINHLQVLEPLEITTTDTSMTLVIDEKIAKIVETTLLISHDRPNIVFCPINAEHPKRNPSFAKSIAIIQALTEFANVYLIGGLSEKPQLLNLAIATKLSPERVFAGKLNLQEAAVFLQHMQVLLSVEAGPMYMAQALNIPVVALFGPTDPLIYGPCGNRDIVLTHKMSCIPCDVNAVCPQNSCIEAILLEEIVQSVQANLSAGNISKRPIA